MGIVTPVKEDSILDKNIHVLIRKLDAKEHKKIAMKDAVKEHWKWIDNNVQNCFYGGVSAGMLKCMLGYNHYGKRNCMINKGLISILCSRCNEQEDWEHVIQCNGINDIKDEFIKQLEDKLKKIKTTDREKDIINVIVQDMYYYLNKNDYHEYTIVQHLVGMSLIFKGWVVKNWENANHEQSQEMKKVNKVIVK